MRRGSNVVLPIALLTLAAGAAEAQDGQSVQITPYVGVGTAGASPVGTAVTFPLTQSLSLETDVAYRRGEGPMHAFSTNASLLFALPRVGQATPYLAGGVGLAQVGVPIFGAAGGAPIGTAPSLAPTINAGGGFTMPMNRTMDMRTDVRWFQSFGTNGSEQFRVAQGISFDAGKR